MDKLICKKLDLELVNVSSIIFDYNKNKWENISIKTRGSLPIEVENGLINNEKLYLTKNGISIIVIYDSINISAENIVIQPKSCVII